MPMFAPHTPTSFKDPPILDAVDDEVAKAWGLIGQMEQLLHELNDGFDGLNDRTTQMVSLASPVRTNPEIADLRQRLSDLKHKDVITEIQVSLDKLKFRQSQYVANIRKEGTKERDKPVQERVAERLKTQDDVARSKRPGLLMSPRNPASAPTLSHTSPVHPPHPSGSALVHSSNSFGLASPPPTSSTPSISSANRLNVSSPTFAQAAAKKADTTGASLKSLTTSTPTPSTPSQSSLVYQRSPGTPPNRNPTIPITLKNFSHYQIEYMYLEDGIKKGGVLPGNYISQEPTMFHLNDAYMFNFRLGPRVESTTRYFTREEDWDLSVYFY